MDSRDRNAIEDLFVKLAEVERQSAPRDAEAESFIRSSIARQPAAPYLMAQTIIVQEQALAAAQARIEELEHQESRPAGGGLLPGIFGGSQRGAPAPGASARPMDQSGGGGPWGGHRGNRGGGFLAGAAQTAMGVAGGVLLGNAIAGLFGSDEAAAAEPDAGSDPGADMDLGGGDMGFGDF